VVCIVAVLPRDRLTASGSTFTSVIKGSYRWLFLALIIADLIYSWFQFYHTPLDGDLAAMVLPAPEYRQSMNDPFGISVLLHHDR
jgi:hypothetical protein